MREYLVTVKYFRSEDETFIAKSESNNLKEIEDKIRKIVQSENDMMEVKQILYEMQQSPISCHKR